MSTGKYKILRALNTKGTVHLAADKDGKKVVLKTLSADSISMYRRIAELPPHSHSERVFECIEQDGNTVAVCEYIEGKTLHELLESGRTFPLKDIKKLICDLCSAVEHLHKNGIIHRDINPNNILLCDKLNLKLIDYSIARLYSSKKDNDTTVLGTEGYSAPEQYGFKETRFTADVYSIGMVLKMLLNNCENGSAAEEVRLRRIAAKCTSFDPDRRYKSATAVRSAIKRSGYVLPVVIGCAVLAFAAVFSLGVFMAARDTEEVSGAVQTTPLVTTTTAVSTATAASVTTSAKPVTSAATSSTATTAAATSATSTTTVSAVTTTASTTKATTKAVTTTASTTKATTTKAATTTAQPVEQPVFQQPEYLELFTLKGSNLDNPNRIEVTSVQEENGHFADRFEYVFYDDPAVHGEWVYCNTWSLTGAKTPATAESIINHEFKSEPILDGLTIYENGNAEIYYSDGGGSPAPAQWTNGYIVTHISDGAFAQRLFVSEIDGVEFLFMEFKSGDYILRGEVNCYYIFVRGENNMSQEATVEAATTAETPVVELPEYLELSTLKGSDLNNPHKMEVTPKKDENGHFSDSFEYEFFDDPAVHGDWVYCNIWLLDGTKIAATAEDIINHEFWGEAIIDALSIHDGGSAGIYYCGSGRAPAQLQWTNGYLICNNDLGVFAERMFVSVIDGVEFLFMEFKLGDYGSNGNSNCYYIFVRNESEAAG